MEENYHVQLSVKMHLMLQEANERWSSMTLTSRLCLKALCLKTWSHGGQRIPTNH